MRKVTAIDASGIHALKQFSDKCKKKGILFILSGVKEPVASILKKTSVEGSVGSDYVFRHLDDALVLARHYSGSVGASAEN